MKTHIHETTKTVPTSRQRECLPCDLPAFCRNHYYTGKLLTKRDLEDEQRYLVDKLRLHHLALHGWGVVCGLKVKPHPYCPDRRIVVAPGLAVDSCGREIRVLREVELELPKRTAPSKTAEPCPPESDYQTTERSRTTEQSEPPQELQQDQSEHQYEPDKPRNQEPREKPPEKCEPTLDLYICLRYAECEQEFSPAPFDDCACHRDGQQPNRICEIYQLEVLTEKPQELDCNKLRRETCKIDDCRALYETMLDPCLAPMQHDCLPLAVIKGYRPGQVVTEEIIDNWECRQLLPSTTLLDQLIRCILEKMPAVNWTKIEDIGWDHGQQYNCHNFMRMFIGRGKGKGFDITFDRPIRGALITKQNQIFQAIVVRYPDRAFGAGIPEIAPSTIQWDPNDPNRLTLDIDENYARNTLQRANFDLYLILRCNLVLDDRGLPVDGNLLAEIQQGNYSLTWPTGDGARGGLFESWLSVRMEHRESTAG